VVVGRAVVVVASAGIALVIGVAPARSAAPPPSAIFDALAATALAAPTAGKTAAAVEPTPAAKPADAAGKNKTEREAKAAFFRDNPWSPLRAFARYDFPPAEPGKESSAVVGASAEANVRLEGPGVEPLQLRLTVLPPEKENGPARFRLDRLAPGGDVRVAGETWAAAAPAGGASRVIDEDTRVEIGPFAIRPYVQADSGIIIMFDSRRTAGAAFVPPAWFPFDPAWVLRAKLVRFPKPETVTMQTSLGRSKEYIRAGYFVLDVPGRSGLKAFAYQPTFIPREKESLSILFTDATTGKESYGTGRYLDLEPPADGVYTLDFNSAYNPLCAYTHVYNCPIPPRENALPVAVRAGEQAYRGHASH
jgi:hypothetical protein